MKIYNFTIKELIILSLGRILQKVILMINYEKHAIVYKELKTFSKKEFDIKRKKNNIILSNKNFGSKKFVIRLFTSDKFVLDQVILQKEYLPMIEMIDEKKLPDSVEVIIDAGANIGLTTIFLNTFYPKARIISIEPDKDNYCQLKKNVKINDLTNRIIVLNKAIWSNTTDHLLISNDFRDGLEWAKSVQKSETSETPVELITLEEIIDKHALKKIDILKMDIEGAEYELFKSNNFKEVLKKHVRFLCLEIHEDIMRKNYFFKIFDEINFDIIDKGETVFCINKGM